MLVHFVYLLHAHFFSWQQSTRGNHMRLSQATATASALRLDVISALPTKTRRRQAAQRE
jgi:hypothetical protein